MMDTSGDSNPFPIVTKLLHNNKNNNNNSSKEQELFNPFYSLRDRVVPLEATVLVVIAYGVLCVISIFGNTIVCYVILKNKRLHTATNFFIATLAVSDILVSLINVPFNIARNLFEDWPFGEVPCILVNYSLFVTSYVSTYTLTSIALDRHRVVLKPLSRRMTRRSAVTILILIWIVAILLSLPFGMYMKVTKVKFLITKEYNRCRFIVPTPFVNFEKYLTVSTFILQYCAPFTLIGIAYGRIVRSLWARTHVGAVTMNQQLSQAKAKRKSIKLLITVVIVFALCWLPLNIYHLLTDLHPNTTLFQYNSLVFFTCHWIALSSTCYNPFIYCWLNKNFREEVKARFNCINHLRYWKRIYSHSNTSTPEGSLKLFGRLGAGNGSPSGCNSSHRLVNGKRETTIACDLLDDQTQSNIAACEPLAPDIEDSCTDDVLQDLILMRMCNGMSTVVFQKSQGSPYDKDMENNKN